MLQTKGFLTKLSQTQFRRLLSTSGVRNLDQKWREQRGLPENPNAEGPLNELPDFSFLDGRPTPLGSNQKKRLEKQRDIAAKIVTMSQELQFAKERFARKQQESTAERARIIENKLKRKGHLLLKSNAGST